ncbi:MAG: NAD(+) diphosphatase [Lysobacteraceae bacterium]|nr:MAG: NAD(+) diphosphatase [Xanthomonadaceae bacterium]
MKTDSLPPVARFAFVEAALDRADALRENADALRAYWPNANVVSIDAAGFAPSDADGRLVTARGADIADSHESAVFLGMREDEAWFARSAAAPCEEGRRTDLRGAAAMWPAFESTLFAQARAVLHWQSRHRFCGSCGREIAYFRGGWLGRCIGCGLEHYPRTDPAVIVAVGAGGRLLLGRQAGWPPRRYSTLAGFVEPGEALEQAVIREVMEESGVRVRECRYLASQPWPFPSSLMLGFIADAEPDPPQADQELEDVRWFDRDEIGAALRGENREHGLLLSPSISISRWLIECWYAGETIAHGA